MERKLSKKATKMRRRFTFTRGSQAGERDSTMITSPGSNQSSTRPRSATSPRSSTPGSSTSGDLPWQYDASRQDDFTDEPGFFRPVSPLIDRPKIDTDLEIDVKHACTLLAHSVERGIPTGLFPQTEAQVPPSANSHQPVQSRQKLLAVSSDQAACLPHPKDLGAETQSSKDKHDSGVAMGSDSSEQPGAATGSARFYEKYLSISPPQEETLARGRSRGMSFDADITSRSRSSSPGLFPYSPPQLDLQFPLGQSLPGSPRSKGQPQSPCAEHVENSHAKASDTGLGAEGVTWLQASVDIQHLRQPDVGKDSSQRNGQKLPISSGPPLRRFYSDCQLLKAFASQGLVTDAPWESRDSSIFRNASRGSLATEDTSRDIPDLYRARHHHPTIYSMAAPSVQPGHKRGRASQLLRKLAGLGMWRKVTDPFAQNPPGQTVEASD
ncbi:hypothetical protein NUU61_009507 [Penicillium alfredii]|uniref:Uncharacterized protein n=1 Tax=Penicillium alfredii TaxID=1506179 RepID=A0A9W9JX88_9EURO|nr:uncharacterized protein NUU61_009507 [Penicillium alfredii]KAJ5084928.1 hypothetical protein NUU61_009507 [Penicillium alfredii]